MKKTEFNRLLWKNFAMRALPLLLIFALILLLFPFTEDLTEDLTEGLPAKPRFEITMKLIDSVSGAEFDHNKMLTGTESYYHRLFQQEEVNVDEFGESYIDTVSKEYVSSYASKIEGYTITNTFLKIPKTGDASARMIMMIGIAMSYISAMAVSFSYTKTKTPTRRIDRWNTLK